MSSKEVIDMGDKHFEQEDIKRVELRGWMDSSRVMAFLSDRSDVNNIFNNYTPMEATQTKALISQVREVQTAQAIFSIDYLRDVLKLLTKLDETVGQVKIKLETDKPISFVIEDDKGSFSIILAPKIID